MTKIGSVGFYIFELVGFDYADVDTKTRCAIDQMVTVYGEAKIAAYAEYLVEIQPDVDLRKLLRKLNNGIADFVMTAEEEDYL